MVSTALSAMLPTLSDALPMTVTGKVNLDLLHENRESGAAPTFRDRRRQAGLYRSWPSHL